MSAALKTGADARAMRMTKFPPEFSKKVDMGKINLPVIQKWVSNEIARILNNEDDVVTEMIFTILQASKSPNIKQLQNDLTGFLDKDAAPFCLELWKLCLSAQEDPNGIPKELLEAKKFELIQERLAEDKAREEAMKRQAEERERDRELARIRERERGQRSRGGRGGRGRDRDRSFDRRPPSRDSRSPPRRRDGPRTTDSYVPAGRGRRDDPPPRRRRRSPSYGDSRSRSRSPPRRRRRYDSSDVSRSPPRRRDRKDSDHENDRNGQKSRPSDRSQSPRRRRSPDSSDRSPPKRRRRSPSLSRSPRRRRDDSSHSRPPKRRSGLGSDDLISRTDRPRDNRRLSRGTSSYSGSMDGANDGAEAADETTRKTTVKYPLQISREALQARLAAAKQQAQRNAEQRRDSGISFQPPASGK